MGRGEGTLMPRRRETEPREYASMLLFSSFMSFFSSVVS